MVTNLFSGMGRKQTRVKGVLLGQPGDNLGPGLVGWDVLATGCVASMEVEEPTRLMAAYIG